MLCSLSHLSNNICIFHLLVNFVSYILCNLINQSIINHVGCLTVQYTLCFMTLQLRVSLIIYISEKENLEQQYNLNADKTQYSEGTKQRITGTYLLEPNYYYCYRKLIKYILYYPWFNWWEWMSHSYITSKAKPEIWEVQFKEMLLWYYIYQWFVEALL